MSEPEQVQAIVDRDDVEKLDPRLDGHDWYPAMSVDRTRRRVRLMLLINVPLAVWYFGWLLQPGRIGNPVLYTILLVAEIFNLLQAVGFWWTCSRARARRGRRWLGPEPDVDVFIPVYNEPVDVVEATVAAATRMRGGRVLVSLLDDGHRDEMWDLADQYDIGYIRREVRTGAKAGNINHALKLTSAPFVAVFDCDHVPDARFLEATLGHMHDELMAFVQTPQYYANAPSGPVAAASWGQQALFFGVIAMGKDGTDATFCCGTNVLFRRTALEDVDGFPEDSLTEDFRLSIELHSRGWNSSYVPQVLAKGLGPEDMASYVSQQQRWARGCLSGLPAALRARLPWRLKLQYTLSSLFWLSGWCVGVYMMLPVVRMLTGEQPLGGVSADQFLIHFAPYFGTALLTVAIAGGGAYTFAAFALFVASFWIHIQATILSLLRRRGRFVVTPKRGSAERQLRVIWPALAMVGVLGISTVFCISNDQSPAMLNNAAFATVHIVVLLSGVWPALVCARDERAAIALSPSKAPA
jgi:cellulose synthase (UDP-forming)